VSGLSISGSGWKQLGNRDRIGRDGRRIFVISYLGVYRYLRMLGRLSVERMSISSLGRSKAYSSLIDKI
jgi:hypothetical protein